MTYEKFIDNIQKLDKSKEYAYYSGRGSYKILDVSDESVQIQVLESDGSEKTISIPKEKIESFLKELKTGKPVYPNNVTKGSGSYRAIAPSLLCLMPHIFFVDIKNNRHLIELSEEHELGKMTKTEKNNGGNFNELNYNRILFGAPGTGKSFILKTQSSPFEDQKKISKDKKDEIRNAIAEAITKSGKLTLLNSIGFKYSDELKSIQRKDLSSYCEYDKIDELYIGSNAKPISDEIQIEKDEQLTDIDFIKDLIQNKKGGNDSLKWANAIGFKFGDFLKDWTLDELRKTFELSEPQMWWIYRGAQASQIRSSEIETEIKYVERVTFHPNYSYAQFVGTYKPVQDSDDKKQIKYEYVPGPFMRMYCAAKKNSNNDFLLIIEEINRANVAAVFGDVFQLLDRKNGVSEYPIAASEDIRNFLADNGINEKELCIPSNMYIWATMNSADQGVFPMDTAFKRRWEFEYIDINNNESEIDSFYLPTCIVEKENKCIFENWNSLRKKLNEKLQLIGVNEDKLLGPFFINKDTLEEISSLIEPRKDEKNEEYISVDFQITTDDAGSQNKKKIEAFQKSFESKVLMYLYEDMRMYRPDIFQIKVDGKDIDKPRLSQIFKAFERDGIEIFNFSTDRS